MGFTFIKLDFGRLLLSPDSWFKWEVNVTWNGHSWFAETSGLLWPIGVGRYAALAAIIGISDLWIKGWRVPWSGYTWMKGYAKRW